MEYFIQAWSPHLKKDIECSERVRRAATGNGIHGLRQLPNEEILAQVGLTVDYTERKKN